jgi:biotin-(acetyl-CoA carboxylase) ligase
MEGNSLLIGVGVNVETAPEIPDSGDNLGRESTCIGNYAPLPDADSVVRGLGEEIATNIGEWFKQLPSSPGDVVGEFSSQVEFGVRIRMREGGWVVPLRIESDGQLLVRVEATGVERLLCSDYML